MNPPDPRLSKSAAGYCQQIQKAGWTQSGEGVGGRVFHRHGDGEVIKVSDGDGCYLEFADYAAANPSPCVPSLRVVHRPGQWAVIHIEKLDPLDPGNAAAVDSWWNALVAAWRAGLGSPQPQSWSSLAAALRPIAIACGCGFDMKESNAMQRGATVVFTDPLN